MEERFTIQASEVGVLPFNAFVMRDQEVNSDARTLKTLKRRLEAVMVREVGDDVVILDTAADRIHQLNGTAGFIWRSLEEDVSAEAIARRLATEFDVEEAVALKDVIDTIGKLESLDLLIAA